MSDRVDEVRACVEPLAAVLVADGYDLRVEESEAEALVARVVATEDACADCLVPKRVFVSMIEQALETGGTPVTVDAIEIVYPSDEC